MMTKKIMKPLLGAVGVTALSFGTMLGFTAPAFAAVDPIVPVTGPNCNSSLPRTLIATLLPGQTLLGSVVTAGPSSSPYTRITDTNGFSQQFPPNTAFTIANPSTDGNDTVSACVFPDSTLGVVTFTVLGPGGTPVPPDNENENENENNRRTTITINPSATVNDSGNSHNNNDSTAKVNDSGNSHVDVDIDNTAKVKDENKGEDKSDQE